MDINNYAKSEESKHYCEIKEEGTLYKIGLFSQMNRVTIKALRHYDDIDLLKPAYIDEVNGYRYYTSSQLPELHQILALRQIGFTLEEIKKVKNGNSVNDVLLKKKSEVLKKIAEETAKLSQIEYYLSHKEIDRGYNIILKEIPEVIVASMRTVVKNYDALFDIVPPMGQEMERLGCVCAVPEYCFNIYHDGEYKEENVNVEICEAVTEIKPDSEMITFKRIPKVEIAACVLHKGSYDSFPKAYRSLMCWMEENGFELSEYPRESYIDGVWNKDSEEEWLTEIQFPLRKKLD